MAQYMNDVRIIKTPQKSDSRFLFGQNAKPLLLLAGLAATIYLMVMAFWFAVGNPYLYAALIVGQVFYLWIGLTYLYSVWSMTRIQERDDSYTPPVDVFITVAGEPVEIVEETLQAALSMDYPNFKVFLLNDGYVAGKENWKDIEELASAFGAECITRRTPGGAKAGNINHALRLSSNPFVAVFDADHVPHADFLRKTVSYFANPKTGFVQTPQYYKNHDLNEVTRGAWEQQEVFFGAICRGKNRHDAVSMCGTNMVIRRSILESVGGMCDHNIAEDFATGLFIHARGYASVYVPEILAEGLAPEDFLSYAKQQMRWARGALEVLFKYNPLFMKNLDFPKRILYLSSASFYLSGVVVTLFSLLPLVYFFTGEVAFVSPTMLLAAAFLPYIFLIIYAIQKTTNFSYTFRALSFSTASFSFQIKVLFDLAIGRKSAFAITPKKALTGNYTRLVLPHIIYVLLVFIGMFVAFARDGLTTSFITNSMWAALNVITFVPFIVAAVPWFNRLAAGAAEAQEGIPGSPLGITAGARVTR